jgi:hypothetical protein
MVREWRGRGRRKLLRRVEAANWRESKKPQHLRRGRKRPERSEEVAKEASKRPKMRWRSIFMRGNSISTPASGQKPEESANWREEGVIWSNEVAKDAKIRSIGARKRPIDVREF